jgi:phosphotransferase system enzyme I (PtsP)
MLRVLRRIVQEVNAAHDLDEALAVIVREVRAAMGVDVCSVYLTDPLDGHQVLMASEGLNPQAVRVVRLRPGQGLVTLAAERAEPINLDEAIAHSRYVYLPETGEERYHSFLGVPIIHHRKVLGVLVTQRKVSRRFDEDEVAFQVTIASQLAGAIAHAEAVGGIAGLGNGHNGPVRRMEGLPGAPGVSIGQAVVIYPATDLEGIPDRPAGDVQAELRAFEAAVAAVREEVRQLGQSIGHALSEEERALFDAYLMMLGSDTVVDKTLARIRAGNWAPGALRETINEHVRVFRAMEDPLLRERASDICDLGRRILEHLQDKGGRSGYVYPPRTILVAEEVSATMLAEVPLAHLVGVVSVHGSQYSHAAILARALAVPCIMGAADLWLSQVDGRELILDGYRGHIYIDPTPGIREEFDRLAQEEARLSEDLKALKDLRAVTQDGHHIPLYANTGLLADINPSLNSGAEGIGLYRTEFPFMIRDRFPGEEEQSQIYRQVLLRFSPRPVTLRTLDVGGDKALTYFPIHEANPFLGWRGIRITLDHPDIFLTQLRAMLRASAGLDNLRLLLPMVSSVDEVDESLALLLRAHAELQEDGVEVPLPKVGVMVEVPAAVYQAAALARRVDFLSVGTNDLTQYLLAVDRNNERVASLYDSLHPAVLGALTQLCESVRPSGLHVGVCGEMAGDPPAVLLLLGMGVDSLSTNAGSLPRVKWVIRNFSRERARALLEEVGGFERATEVRGYLVRVLEEAGLGGLIRAGK